MPSTVNHALAQQQRRLLIVNADDLGYSKQRDDAILQAFEHGCLTSASLLVNAKTSNMAAKRALALGLPLGLHLNLSEFSPISPAIQVPSLVRPRDGSEDQACFRGKFGIRDCALVEHEVELEICAQIERFIQLCDGNLPMHVDGHQHVHVLPQVRAPFARALQRFGITKTRMPVQTLTFYCSDFLLQVVAQAKASQEIFAQHGLVFPQCFIGMDLSSNNTLEKLWSALAAVPRLDENEVMVTEWMCHPGQSAFAVKEEEDLFSQSPDRQNELDLLLDFRVQSIISDEEGFELSSFAYDLPATPLSVMAERRKKMACVLAPIAPWTGNQSTALRFRAHLLSIGWDVILINANSLDLGQSFDEICKFHGVELVLAIHAYRSGKYLLHTKDLPYIIVLGGTDMNEGGENVEMQGVVKTVLERASGIVAFNESLAARAKAILKQNAPVLRIVPQSVLLPTARARHGNGKRAKQGRFEGKTTMLLPLGVRAVKDPFFLIDCVERNLPQVTLVICGPVVDKDLHASLLARISQSKNVQYMGPMLRADLIQAMRECEFVLNSSISEGQSNTLLEAMSTGHALVVARNNEGNRSLIEHGVTGYLFNTPEEFVSIIQQVLEEKDGRNSSSNNRRIVSNALDRMKPLERLFQDECRAYEELIKAATGM